MWAVQTQGPIPTHKTKLSPSRRTLSCDASRTGSCFQSLSAIRDESDLASMEARIVAYSEDITELSSVLMTLEMQLVEQLEVRGALARDEGAPPA